MKTVYKYEDIRTGATYETLPKYIFPSGNLVKYARLVKFTENEKGVLVRTDKPVKTRRRIDGAKKLEELSKLKKEEVSKKDAPNSKNK